MKRILSRLAFIMLCTTLTIHAYAQDIRYSQFYSNMVAYNPGAVGAFGGDYRFIADYRAMTSGEYTPLTTVYASLDMGLWKYKNPDRESFFAAGISYLQDQAGEGSLTLNEINVSLAYNLNVAEGSFLTAGIRAGQASRSVDNSVFTWDSQYNNNTGVFDPNAATGEEGLGEEATYVPVSTGLMWSYTKKEKFRFNVGFAMNNLNSPDAAFSSSLTEEVPTQMVVNFAGEYMINNSIVSILPVALYTSSDINQETTVGALAKISMSFDSKFTGIKKSSAFYLGALYRTSNDFIAMMKFNLRYKLSVGLSYDLDIDSSTRDYAATEVVLIYSGFFNAKNKMPRKGSTEFF